MKTDYLTPTRPPLLPMDYVYITHRLRLPLAPLVFFEKRAPFQGPAPCAAYNHDTTRVREGRPCTPALSSAAARQALPPQPPSADFFVYRFHSTPDQGANIASP